MPALKQTSRTSVATDRNNWQTVVAAVTGFRIQLHRLDCDKVLEQAGGQVVQFRWGTNAPFITRQLLGSNGVKSILVLQFGSDPVDGPHYAQGGISEALQMRIFDANSAADAAPTDIFTTAWTRVGNP